MVHEPYFHFTGDGKRVLFLRLGKQKWQYMSSISFFDLTLVKIRTLSRTRSNMPLRLHAIFFPFLGKLSACRKRLLSWMKNSHRDKHFPWCRADGSFNPMQCYGSYCYCVNEKGIEMPGTKISTSMGRPVCTFTSRRESNRMTFFFSIVKDFYVRHLPCFVCLRWHCDFLST